MIGALLFFVIVIALVVCLTISVLLYVALWPYPLFFWGATAAAVIWFVWAVRKFQYYSNNTSLTPQGVQPEDEEEYE